MSKRVHLVRAAVIAGLLTLLVVSPAAPTGAAVEANPDVGTTSSTAPERTDAVPVDPTPAHVVEAKGKNVWEGVTPSWGPFNKIFKSKTTVFLSLAWLVGFIFLAFHLIMSVAGIVRARRQGIGDELADTRKDIGLTVVAVIIMAALPAIWLVLT